MGAVCTRVDVSPEVVQTLFQINKTHRNYVYDASFETIWKYITPHIDNPEKKIIIQQL